MGMPHEWGGRAKNNEHEMRSRSERPNHTYEGVLRHTPNCVLQTNLQANLQVASKLGTGTVLTYGTGTWVPILIYFETKTGKCSNQILLF